MNPEEEQTHINFTTKTKHPWK